MFVAGTGTHGPVSCGVRPGPARQESLRDRLAAPVLESRELRQTRCGSVRKDRREVDPPIHVQTATWSSRQARLVGEGPAAAGTLLGRRRLGRTPPARHAASSHLPSSHRRAPTRPRDRARSCRDHGSRAVYATVPAPSTNHGQSRWCGSPRPIPLRRLGRLQQTHRCRRAGADTARTPCGTVPTWWSALRRCRTSRLGFSRDE